MPIEKDWETALLDAQVEEHKVKQRVQLRQEKPGTKNGGNTCRSAWRHFRVNDMDIISDVDD